MFLTILALYIIGMPLIGYPIGKLSLKAWKFPRNYSRLGGVLFPHNSTSDTIGKYAPDGEGGCFNAPLAMNICFHRAWGSEDDFPKAKYLVLQMLFWPARVAYLALYQVLFTVNRLALLLARCKKCVET